MKITNDTALLLDENIPSSHIWVIPYWDKGRSCLKVVVNGSQGMHLAIEHEQGSCKLISADPEVNAQHREKVLSKINELLKETGEETETVKPESLPRLRKSIAPVK